MTSSFTAYIDEAGDEGFKFLPNEKGSSRWFVISAAVFRSSSSLVPISILKNSRITVGKPPNYVLHFRDLRHEQRVAYVAEITKHPMRIVSVAVYKPGINEPERYQSGKFLLYKYVTRLLLERVSWLCRDTRRAEEGDGTVDLVFSDRAAMSYGSLRSYLSLLRAQSASSDRVRIEWETIDPTRVRAVAHSQLAGLQVADAVASATFSAVQLSNYGHAEPRYVQMLRTQVYAHKSVRTGYGLKFWPGHETLKDKMPHLSAFDDW